MSTHDQAHTLRTWAHQRGNRNANGAPAQVVAVASGKGGVGKTALVASLAVAAARGGRRVLAVDGDLGLANLDLAFGIRPQRTLLHVLQGECAVDDILVPAPGGVSVLPAGHGRFELANLSAGEQQRLFDAMDHVADRFDLVLIDTGAGIGTNSLALAGAAQHVLLVATPDPTSMVDAYGFVKVLSSRAGVRDVHLVANMVRDAGEGELLYQRLAGLLDRFLGVGLHMLGAVVADHALARSVRASVPVILQSPYAASSACMLSIARKLQHLSHTDHGGLRLFRPMGHPIAPEPA